MSGALEGASVLTGCFDFPLCHKQILQSSVVKAETCIHLPFGVEGKIRAWQPF